MASERWVALVIGVPAAQAFDAGGHSLLERFAAGEFGDAGVPARRREEFAARFPASEAGLSVETGDPGLLQDAELEPVVGYVLARLTEKDESGYAGAWDEAAIERAERDVAAKLARWRVVAPVGLHLVQGAW